MEDHLSGQNAKYVAARDNIELRVATIYQKTLGVQGVGVADDFFELGGDSLTGMEAVMRISKEFEIELSLRQLFEAPTVSGIAAMIRQSLQK